MIYGKPVDEGFAEYEAAWDRADSEVVGAVWEDPIGVFMEYFASGISEADERDVYVAFYPNMERSDEAALESGRAMARLVAKARAEWVERRRDEILAREGR